MQGRCLGWIAACCRLFAAAFAGAIVLAATAGAEPKLLEERSSTYNNIYVYKDGSQVLMTFGHNKRLYTESIYDTTDELALPVTYTRFSPIALAYSTGLDNLLEIGFGGGRTAWYLHKHVPTLDITAAELDPAVVDLAKKYFGIRTEDKFKVEVADGRNYMVKNSTTWNIIMIDAYRGPFVPFHLLTEEFFKIVKSKLKPGGVVVQNIEPSTMMFDSAVTTIKRVFANVDIYDAGGNVIAIAYDGPEKTDTVLLARANALQKQYNFKYPLPEFPAKRLVVRKAIAGGKVLTDDFAPVESLLAVEKHNRKLDDIAEPAKK
jgi:spermidine synthase